MAKLLTESGGKMINFKGKEYQCTLEVALQMIGGRWKPLILWYLSSGTLRFNELRRMLPKVTQKMLTQQLRELEHDRLVNRVIYVQIPPKVEYSLTEAAKSLLPSLLSLRQWGAYYLEGKEYLEDCKEEVVDKKDI